MSAVQGHLAFIKGIMSLIDIITVGKFLYAARQID
jgi:hypothetical protein